MIDLDTIAEKLTTATGAEVTAAQDFGYLSLTITTGIARYVSVVAIDGQNIDWEATRLIKGRHPENVGAATISADDEDYLMDILTDWVRTTRTSSTL